MTAVEWIRRRRIALYPITVVFLPFACGYFLSYAFRTINSLVADDLLTDLGIGQDRLGIMTAAYFLAFAVCQLPVGIMLDQFGPRRVQSSLMTVTTFGAVIFGAANGFFGLVLGRTLLGIGLSSALMAALKANAIWFPRERLGLVNGCSVATGGLGALAASYPADLVLQTSGWRGLFVVMAAASALCAILVFLLVPPSATAARSDSRASDFGPILRAPLFRRIAPLATLTAGMSWAVQGLWAARWLADVNKLDHGAIVTHLGLMAVGLTVGSLFFGVLNDWARRHGLTPATVLASIAAVFLCVQIAVVSRLALPTTVIWSAFSLFSAMPVLAYSALSAEFSDAQTGRAVTCLNVLQQIGAFVVQSMIGIILAIVPGASSSKIVAYQVAFAVPISLQMLALTWLLFAQWRPKATIAQQRAAVTAAELTDSTRIAVTDLSAAAISGPIFSQTPCHFVDVSLGPDGRGLPCNATSGGALDLPASKAVRTIENDVASQSISPAHVAALNAVHRRRPAFAITIAGRRVTVAVASPITHRRSRIADCGIVLRIAGRHSELSLPRSVLDLLISRVEPTLSTARLAPDHAAVILEFALSPILDEIESGLGNRIAIATVAPHDKHIETGLLTIVFTLAIEELGTHSCELRVTPDIALEVARGLDRYAGIAPAPMDLAIPVRIRRGAARLTAGEIESLTPGDIIVVDRHCETANGAVAVIGEHLVAPITLTEDGGDVISRPALGLASPWAWSLMSAANLAPSIEADGEDSRHIVFESGRCEVKLSAIRRLAPNERLQFWRSPDDYLEIIVGGHKIGRGILLTSDHGLGVKVTSLADGRYVRRSPDESYRVYECAPGSAARPRYCGSIFAALTASA